MNDLIPFQGAILDLDGTVLDSLGVWRHVDERFFGARGLAIPPDYVQTIAGMSFTETAAYTLRVTGLPMTVEEVMAEWMALAADEYAHDVGLVPGVRAYLRMLRRSGIRLAAATANRPALIEPALENCGIRELFDAVLTTGETGDRNKSDGELFRRAAQRLGLSPADCVVFEDTLEGIRGARAAGMRAYAVNSLSCRLAHDDIAPLAEGIIDDYGDMRRFHPFPDNARRCVIFTARCEGDPAAACQPRPGDWVVCADGGWRIARSAGIVPDDVIGDFDSSDVPDRGPVERYPVEKDDTDTMIAIRTAIEQGFASAELYCALGGRLDHTLANLQSLHYAARRGSHAEMSDGLSWATVLTGGSVTVPRRPGKLSVFSLGDACRGVTIRGAKYNADGITLTNAFPLGAGNSFAADAAEIGLEAGALLVMVCPE